MTETHIVSKSEINQSEISVLVDFDLSKDFNPQIVFRHISTNEDTTIELFPNEEIKWYIGRDKYCIGYHIYDEYHKYVPCPDKCLIDKGLQCEKCTRRDKLIPCMLCTGLECYAEKAIQDICHNTLTSVYLVSFADVIKVGVSRTDRLLKRWIEQGADFAVEVARIPNGMVAREVESSIAQEFGIAKGVRAKQKALKLFGDGDYMIGLELKEKAHKISDWVASKFNIEFGVKTDVNDLDQYYKVSNIVQPFEFDIAKNGCLQGTFLGMKGPLFLFESFGDQLYVDIKKLQGRVINKNRSSNTSSLTDFF